MSDIPSGSAIKKAREDIGAGFQTIDPPQRPGQFRGIDGKIIDGEAPPREIKIFGIPNTDANGHRGPDVPLRTFREGREFEDAKKGYVVFKQIQLPDAPGKIFLDKRNTGSPSLLQALSSFQNGDVHPDNLAVLFHAMDDQSIFPVGEEWEIQYGRSFKVLFRRLEMIRAGQSRPEPKPLADAFEAHRITLPCGDKIHYSNVEPVTTCHQCGSKFTMEEIYPKVIELMEKNPELSQNQAKSRSRMDLWNALKRLGR